MLHIWERREVHWGCGGVIQGCVDHLEELGTDGWLELKCIPKNGMDCYGQDRAKWKALVNTRLEFHIMWGISRELVSSLVS